MGMKKFMNVRWGILAGIIGIAVVLAVYLVVSMVNSPETQVRRALELGERYLLEGEYEQAIVQFTSAIEITDREPKLVVLGDQARDNRDSAVKEGAVELLQTPGKDLEDVVEWISENDCLGIPAAYPFVDAYDFLRDLEELCAAEDYDTVFNLLADPDYKEIVSRIMGLNCQMALLNDETGMMTAVYRMDVETDNFASQDDAEEQSEEATVLNNGQTDQNEVLDGDLVETSDNYMVYYGAHSEEIREGEGVWLAFQEGNNYLASGSWTEDQPNGRFETRSWQVDLNESVIYRVVIGEVVNGLWDGPVIWRFERGTEVDEYSPTFHQGVWQILREEDGLSIGAENEDGGLLVVTEPQKLNGLVGYAEAA